MIVFGSIPGEERIVPGLTTQISKKNANQPSTKGGEVIEGTRVAEFIELSKRDVHVPLSGVVMEFDGKGQLK